MIFYDYQMIIKIHKIWHIINLYVKKYFNIFFWIYLKSYYQIDKIVIVKWSLPFMKNYVAEFYYYDVNFLSLLMQNFVIFFIFLKIQCIYCYQIKLNFVEIPKKLIQTINTKDTSKQVRVLVLYHLRGT
jgi:hypothetical protein